MNWWALAIVILLVSITWTLGDILNELKKLVRK